MNRSHELLNELASRNPETLVVQMESRSTGIFRHAMSLMMWNLSSGDD
jgi:hypothetical protein